MVSTYTTGMGLEKLADGDGSGTWGTTQNNNFDAIDRGVMAVNSFTVTTDAALSAAETQHSVHRLGGSPAANRTLTFNADKWKRHIIDNRSGKVITFRGSAGTTTTVAVPANRGAMVLNSDNSNVLPIYRARGRNAAYYPVKIVAAATGAVTVDTSERAVHQLTLTGNVTFTFSNWPTSGLRGAIVLRVIQDGTGSRTITWPAAVDWPGGIAQAPASAAGSITDYVLQSVDGGTTIQANLAGKAMAA